MSANDWPVGGLAPGVSASIGTAIHGGSSPSPTRKRPDLCAEYGHPGVTYNPWRDVTACLCGLRWQEGDQVVVPYMDKCGGPLEEVIS